MAPPFIADHNAAQRVLPDYDYYLDPDRSTVAGFTGQTHVAALCVQKVADAGRKKRERGVMDGSEWSDLLLVSTGANGAALLRKLLRSGCTPLMEEAWLRARCPPFYQPVILRTFYVGGAIHAAFQGMNLHEQLEELLRSRLADEFRPRFGVLRPPVHHPSSAIVLPSVDQDSNGSLIWSEPFVTHFFGFAWDYMLHHPNVTLVDVNLPLPSSDFGRSASVPVPLKTHRLAVLMAYEVEQMWRAFDRSLPANIRPSHNYAWFNVLNLLLLHDLHKARPDRPECSLSDLATFARHAAMYWLGAGGYRRMYDWIMQYFAPQETTEARVGRKSLAVTIVNMWIRYEVWPSLYDERAPLAHRDSNRREVAALLRDAFACVYDQVKEHPPSSARPNQPHDAFVPGSRNS